MEELIDAELATPDAIVFIGKKRFKTGPIQATKAEITTLRACGHEVLEPGELEAKDLRAKLKAAREEAAKLEAKVRELEPKEGEPEDGAPTPELKDIGKVEDDESGEGEGDDSAEVEEVTLPSYQDQVSALSKINQLPSERSKEAVQAAYVKHVLKAEVV